MKRLKLGLRGEPAAVPFCSRDLHGEPSHQDEQPGSAGPAFGPGGCRRNMVGSLPRGMPKVVDYRQTDAQAPNKMVTQDRHEVLSWFGRREGVIPTSCV